VGDHTTISRGMGGNSQRATLPDEWRDSASLAVVAYAGGGEAEPVDVLKRRLFWEWWLQEAIPSVWKRAAE